MGNVIYIFFLDSWGVTRHDRQPLDSFHNITVVVVTFVGKWATVSVVQLIHKKAAGALCRQQSFRLIKRFSPAAHLSCEKGIK
jgi:hypothetical protein